MENKIDPVFLFQQKAEITEHHVYARLAELSNDDKNKSLLKHCRR